MPIKDKTITPEAQARARVTGQFGKMPYGSMCGFTYTFLGMSPELGSQRATEAQFLNAVADNLDKLRETLERVSRDASNAETELAQYKEAARGMRFLLNTKEAS